MYGSASRKQHPRILIDRHGGRTHYREDLQLAFPEARITIVCEDDRLSRYRLDAPGDRSVTVTFTTQAEAKHLPVALSSMAAKYTRELMMARMNRFFTGHLPDLKPTAGYVTDARRYLKDIDPVIRNLQIERRELVRSC